MRSNKWRKKESNSQTNTFDQYLVFPLQKVLEGNMDDPDRQKEDNYQGKLIYYLE